MKFLRPSKNLQALEERAFDERCTSLDGIFLPPTMEEIGYRAFGGGKKLRMFLLPSTINLQRVSDAIIQNCDALLTNGYGLVSNEDKVKYRLMHNMDNFPLHKIRSQIDDDEIRYYR